MASLFTPLFKHTLRRSFLLASRLVVVMLGLAAMQNVASAQVDFLTTRPIIDSFPIVRIGVSITDGGLPPNTLTSSDFTVTEDGNNVSPLELINCHGQPSAAIALLVDASSSMFSSAGNGNYNAYYNSFSKFLALVSPPSELALIPFTDTAFYYFPGVKKCCFYQAGNKPDTTAFMDSLRSIQFQGNTNIDIGLNYAISVLATSAQTRKIIVLATDDGVINEAALAAKLASLDITLFVMELGPDSIYANQELALEVGGKYYQAMDSTRFTPIMTTIAEELFSERCTLRYRSTNPCPWLATHPVNVRFAYKSTNLNSALSYIIGKNTHDSIAPNLLIDSSQFTSRIVQGFETYPCGSGIRSFTDSALKNFAKLKQKRGLPNTASDSLIVLDTLQDAHGWYVVRDSANNYRRIELIYHPKPDTIAPQIPLPTYSGGAYTVSIQEFKPWDRGINNVTLDAGAKNLSLDSVQYISNRFARAYLRVLVQKDSAHGCITAVDSFGNKSSSCVQWNGIGGDTLPPLFKQDPIAEPRLTLSGVVSDQRAGDNGLQNVIVTPVSNTSAPNVKFTSVWLATVSVALIDSLYPALAAVDGTDSAGNRVQDTLRYFPLPDNLSPECTLTNPTQSTMLVSATEIQAWDRGIRTIVMNPINTNVNAAAPVFTDSRHASMLITIQDITAPASATVIATDSLGNTCSSLLLYSPNIKTVLPLTIAGPLDFGKVVAPAKIRKTINVTNPNTDPVTLVKVVSSGDDSVFTWIESVPLTLAAGETRPFTFDFIPNLIGTWNASYRFSSDSIVMGTIQTKGVSTGAITIAVDTLTLGSAGDLGMLHLRLNAAPAPINFDSISFVLTYDHDVVTLKDPTLDCGSNPADTGLCNYTISSYMDNAGDHRIKLVRNDRLKSPAPQFANNVFSIPARSYLARSRNTVVTISKPDAGPLVTVGSNSGMVTMGDICADSTIRGYLYGRLATAIEGITPNPARSQLNITINSKTGGKIAISITDALGHEVLSEPRNVSVGNSQITLDLRTIPSGSYQLTLTSDGKRGEVFHLDVVK
jgi:hypothetical protein